jgi:hypothetical protein
MKKLFANINFKFEASELENLMCAISCVVLCVLSLVLVLTFALLGEVVYIIPVPFIAYSVHKLINQNQF